MKLNNEAVKNQINDHNRVQLESVKNNLNERIIIDEKVKKANDLELKQKQDKYNLNRENMVFLKRQMYSKNKNLNSENLNIN